MMEIIYFEGLIGSL